MTALTLDKVPMHHLDMDPMLSDSAKGDAT